MGTPGASCSPPVKWPMTGCSSVGKFMTPEVVGCWRTPTEEVVWQPFRLTVTSSKKKPTGLWCSSKTKNGASDCPNTPAVWETLKLGSCKVLFWQQQHQRFGQTEENGEDYVSMMEVHLFSEEIFSRYNSGKNSIRASKWMYMMTHIYTYATWSTPMKTYLFKSASLGILVPFPIGD